VCCTCSSIAYGGTLARWMTPGLGFCRSTKCWRTSSIKTTMTISCLQYYDLLYGCYGKWKQLESSPLTVSVSAVRSFLGRGYIHAYSTDRIIFTASTSRLNLRKELVKYTPSYGLGAVKIDSPSQHTCSWCWRTALFGVLFAGKAPPLAFVNLSRGEAAPTMCELKFSPPI
jgi:hypothetical protein